MGDPLTGPPTERRRLERERTALLAQLRGLGNLMRGTIVRVGVQCGRPGCACTQGTKHEKIHLAVSLPGGAHLGLDTVAMAMGLARRRHEAPPCLFPYCWRGAAPPASSLSEARKRSIWSLAPAAISMNSKPDR